MRQKPQQKKDGSTDNNGPTNLFHHGWRFYKTYVGVQIMRERRVSLRARAFVPYEYPSKVQREENFLYTQQPRLRWQHTTSRYLTPRGACLQLTSVTADNRPLPPTPPQWNWCRSAGRREIPKTTALFVTEKQPSIAIGWSAPVCGRKLHPPKSSAFHGALFQELAVGLGVVKSTCSAS